MYYKVKGENLTMNSDEIKEVIYNKYIVPVVNKNENSVGVELEMPVINIDKKAVDFEAVHQVTQAFINNLGFTPINFDDNNNVYLAENKATGDTLSYDYSYNNMEFSMGRERDLNVVYNRVKEYYAFAASILQKYNHMITGMGVNPHYMYNDNNALPGERYRMIQNHLESYEKYNRFESFHKYPEFGAFACASQVQLDIDDRHLLQALNVFSKLEPIKAVLFSNSLFNTDCWNLLCARDRFWESGMYGYNPHNIGAYDIELTSIDELVNYISGTSIFNTARKGKYIHFEPLPVSEYFLKDSINGKVYKDGEFTDIKIQPVWDDLFYLRSYKFADLTYRGTIEFRSSCCQPVSDCITVAAFHAGLMEKLDEAEQLLKNDTVIYSQGYSASELRKKLITVDFPEFINKEELKSLLQKVLNIALSGLKARGKNEEKFLYPLFERAEKLESPGRRMYNGIKSGESIEKYIELYS